MPDKNDFADKYGDIVVHIGPGSKKHLFSSGAVGYEAVVVGGIWHKSLHKINNFLDDKSSQAGDYGRGTYIGSGKYSVPSLAGSEHFCHDLAFRGNILIFPVEAVDEISRDVMKAAGMDDAEVPDSAKLGELVRDTDIDGIRYDGLLMYWTGEPSAMGIVFDPQAHLTLVSVHQDRPLRP